MLRAVLAYAMGTLALAAIAVAQQKKPAVPPGLDPGGVAVALISVGIDYAVPGLAQRLARDGEGELIGWDLEDNDRRPFEKAQSAQGTGIAVRLVDAGGVRLVPVRIKAADPATFARAVAFVAQTPARIALLSGDAVKPEMWPPLAQAAAHFKLVLVIVALDAAAAVPAGMALDNVLTVEPKTESDIVGGGELRLTGPQTALALAAKEAAALVAREPRLDAQGLKRRLIETGSGKLWRPRK